MVRLPDALPIYELPHRNPKNKWLSLDIVQAILREYGITDPPRNIELYQQAFVHPSFILTPKVIDAADPSQIDEYSQQQLDEYARAIPMQTQCYERLEFNGDSQLCSVVGSYLCDRYPDMDQGFLTRIRIELVKGDNLSKLTACLKWGQYMMLSRQYESHRYTDSSYLEDVFESFLGAVFLDFGGYYMTSDCRAKRAESGMTSAPNDRAQVGSGPQQVYTFVINIMERFLNFSQIIYRDDNYKDLLLQYYHRTFDGQFPKYKPISTKDKYNRRMYTVGVLNIDDHVIATGSDPKKIRAEQKASKNALKYYNQPVCSSESETD